MKSGQYIVITHNDALITDAQVLYGVSMHEGISKILSLKLTQNIKSSSQQEQEQNQLTQTSENLKTLKQNPKSEIEKPISEMPPLDKETNSLSENSEP